VSLPCEIREAKGVMWDFDGVIKDSVDVKTRAFAALFSHSGVEVVERVREHHLRNGGMPRFEKIPVYLDFAGEAATPERVQELVARFGAQVVQEVVSSPWVAGVEAYLRENPYRQSFALISATPRDELVCILEALGLLDVFLVVYGAPTSKSEGVAGALRELNLLAEDCVFIGDAASDQAAASAHGVPFVLRRHPSNECVFAGYDGPAIETFLP